MTKLHIRRNLKRAGKEAGVIALMLVVYALVVLDPSLRLDLRDQ